MNDVRSIEAPSDPRKRDWWPTGGLAVSIIVGILLMLFGMLSGRLQPIAIAMPLLLGSAWSWLRRPQRRGTVSLSARAESTNESRVGSTIGWRPGGEALRVRVSAPGHRSVDAVLAAPSDRGERRIGISIRTARTGRRPIFTVDHGELADLQLMGSTGGTEGPMPITVLPRAEQLREVPLPYRLQGLTGPHDSRRAGDGNDLRDINLFTPGDRLRRIDWRVTARRNSGGFGGPGTITDLYVRRSYATADAGVMLVLDSRDEVGPDLTTWNDSSSIAEDEPTSLDHARTAALTLARRYLQAGDRVGLEDLGRMRRPMPPAGGMRQLQRLTVRIALAEPEGEPRARRRAPRLPSGALIIICSTFLDDETGKLAQLWHGAGHRVIAVDVLPEPELRHAPGRLLTAYRIIAMDRHDRLAELARSGIEVISWRQAETQPMAGRIRRSAPVGLTDQQLPVALATLSRRRVRR
ncbi:DUF58 domain-containing protein [Microlunatus soli]|uniref:Uncharacterized conserved protein, DUF58 family, contains vWF domain n=1 Tax=Microlunatus soli TaxID=630515 RepID=A0A1H1Z3R0_9ACTN|nr:DUF58 domain-containing protein [Microlunatus soli]SDT28290.1 Uncharacterized conserved protein, DUF58 family, contains vWF domain [Microlunatus soli]